MCLIVHNDDLLTTTGTKLSSLHAVFDSDFQSDLHTGESLKGQSNPGTEERSDYGAEAETVRLDGCGITAIRPNISISK